jgi:hypothetical protein
LRPYRHRHTTSLDAKFQQVDTLCNKLESLVGQLAGVINTAGTKDTSSSSARPEHTFGDELVQAANVLQSLPHGHHGRSSDSREESDSICDDGFDSDLSDDLDKPGHGAAAMVTDSYGRPRYAQSLPGHGHVAADSDMVDSLEEPQT